MANRYTFTSLFKEGISIGDGCKPVAISQVVIPRIQRPYAQGRKDDESQKVREKFLKALFAVLCGESKEQELDLNFIYGKVHGVEKDDDMRYEMQLLDGQQRFTTLFLLHWYLLIREQVKQEDGKDIIRALQSFRYETRDTSTQFCKMLGEVVNSERLISFFDTDDDKTPISPRKAIKRSLDYVHSYESDPTIGGMMTMLDAIDRMYNEKYGAGKHGEIWKNLDNIYFRVLSLTEYKLSEELYIKMNARGLPLSPFECFKSDFLGLLGTPELDTVAGKIVDPTTGEPATDGVTFKQYFANKLDSYWCDCFWDSKEPDMYDSSYMLFFSRYFSARYLIDMQGEITGRKWREASDLKILFTTHEEDHKHYHDIETFENLVKMYGVSTGYFDDIAVILNLLRYDKCKGKVDLIDAMIPLWRRAESEGGKNAVEFDYFCNGERANNGKGLSQPQLVMLSAVISFLHYFPKCPISIFRAWMKSVNCIVENTDISNMQDVAAAVGRFETMIRNISNDRPEGEFDFYIAMSHLEKTGTAANDEEIEKAHRISEDKDLAQKWILLFDEVMRHPFLKGTIGFYYSNNMSLDEFSRQFKLVASLFDADGISDEYKGSKHDYILLRAILSQITCWNELDQRYVTERHEGKKRLKNLLVSNQHPKLQSRIRELFTDRMFNMANAEGACEDINKKVYESLKSAIVNAPSIETSDWQEREAILVLRESSNFYEWVEKQNAENSEPVRIYRNQNQIQARSPKQWSFLMMSVFRYAYSLAEKFVMEKKPAIAPNGKVGRDGFNKDLDMFTGQECVLQKPLGDWSDVTLEVRFYASNHRSTPVAIKVKWNRSKIADKDEDTLVTELTSALAIDTVDIEDRTVGEINERAITVGEFDFNPCEVEGELGDVNLENIIKKLIKVGAAAGSNQEANVIGA